MGDGRDRSKLLDPVEHQRRSARPCFDRLGVGGDRGEVWDVITAEDRGCHDALSPGPGERGAGRKPATSDFGSDAMTLQVPRERFARLIHGDADLPAGGQLRSRSTEGLTTVRAGDGAATSRVGPLRW